MMHRIVRIASGTWQPYADPSLLLQRLPRAFFKFQGADGMALFGQVL